MSEISYDVSPWGGYIDDFCSPGNLLSHGSNFILRTSSITRPSRCLRILVVTTCISTPVPEGKWND